MDQKWVPKRVKVHFRKEKGAPVQHNCHLSWMFSQHNRQMCLHSSHTITAQTTVISVTRLLISLTSHSTEPTWWTQQSLHTSGFSWIRSTWQWRRTKDGGAEGAGPSVSAEIPVSPSERQDLRWWWCRAKMEEQRGRGPHLFLLSELLSSEEKGL